MRIIDLDDAHEGLYLVCLEDWSTELTEAGDHKRCWYERFKDRGLRVKLALDERGEVGGMIQYLPIELSPADGRDLYFTLCIWVHGHKQGRGDFQKRGMGKALLRAAEEDVKALGAKGFVVWGLSLPFFMRASWFKKHGYQVADRLGIQLLLWKPFAAEAQPPKWIKPRRKPESIPGRVTITAFINGWCPAQNLVYERAKRAAAALGEGVVFQGIDTSMREVFLDWGISDGLFIDGKAVRTGPPPSYEKIEGLIAKRLRRIAGRGAR